MELIFNEQEMEYLIGILLWINTIRYRLCTEDMHIMCVCRDKKAKLYKRVRIRHASRKNMRYCIRMPDTIPPEQTNSR